jgi:predicted small lipoprotein YifL
MKPSNLKRIWSWVALAVVLSLGACGQAAPTATLTAGEKLAAIGQSIDTAERTWNQQAIRNYRITTSYASIGHDITMTVVVRDGQVVEHTCVPEEHDVFGCDWAAEYPEKYTVAELFATLHKLYRNAQIPTMDPPADKALDFVYDDQLGYPKRIVWNPIEYSEWNVTAFERLP